jgi:drug/metabolite transporter (DMT)-like permease
MGTLEWVLLIILATVWGASFFLAKIAVDEVPPLTLVFCRVSLAAVTLFFYFKLSSRTIPLGIALWGAFLLMGLINNVIPFSLLFWGQTQIASGLASILNATTPIFTVLVAHVLTNDERLNSHRLIGVVFGFVGVAVMLGGGFVSSAENPTAAMIACLGAALSYAFASVFGRRFAAMNIGPARVAFGQLTASSLIMIPIILLVDPPLRPLSWSLTAQLAVVALAIICTALAYILFFRILATGGATNISLVTLLVPVSAILLGTILLNEQLAVNDFIGMALIGLGLVATDGRIFNLFRTTRPAG